MVQTRSAAQKIESGQVHSEDVIVTKDSAVDTPSPRKKRRREGSTATPKKRRRGKPGEICQLNLDVLFLVRDFFWCFNRLLTDVMVIDRCIRPPHRPPQPCTHMQISSTAPHGQILGVRMEDRSLPSQWPS
jgi:hypothetical protein